MKSDKLGDKLGNIQNSPQEPNIITSGNSDKDDKDGNVEKLEDLKEIET